MWLRTSLLVRLNLISVLLPGLFSTDKIMRERQRQEICGALRGSNLYYNMFMVKNIVEIFLAIIFIAINLNVGLESSDNTALCTIELLDMDTMVVMQCRQKRYDVFIHLLCFFTSTLAVHAMVNVCTVCWGHPSTGLRQISGLMAELQEAIKTSRASKKSIKLGKSMKKRDISYDVELGLRLSLAADSTAEYLVGADFLFLFDLVACTCGKAATLRVLSYTSPSFERLCQPRIVHSDIIKSETSLKVSWSPTPLQNISHYNKLEVTEYVATIFPGNTWKSLAGDVMEVEFQSLSGGTTEYTITVSAIIGNSKMKGVATKQFLPPFPPQNLTIHPSEILQGGLAGARLTWTPPKGDFHKYSIQIISSHALKHSSSRQSSKSSMVFRQQDETWLPKETTEYMVAGLLPGERYQVVLRSMTDYTKNNKDDLADDLLLTKPLPPSIVGVVEDAEMATVTWQPPLTEGHSNLMGYKVKLRDLFAGVVLKEEFVSRSKVAHVVFTELVSSKEHMVEIQSVCHGRLATSSMDMTHPGAAHIFSDLATRIFVTLPRPPTNLRVENCQPTALNLKWDMSLECSIKPSFALLLIPLNPEVMAVMREEVRTKETDSMAFTFSKLPEVVGSGQPYEVVVEAVVSVAGKNYYSKKTKRTFLTKPLPPDKMIVLDNEKQTIAWRRSKSSTVQKYKMKIKREDERAKDFIVEDARQNQGEEEADVSFDIPFPLQDGFEYKINIYSVVDHQGQVIESEPCHAKVARDIWFQTLQAFRDYENNEFFEEGRGRVTIKLIRWDAPGYVFVQCQEGIGPSPPTEHLRLQKRRWTRRKQGGAQGVPASCRGPWELGRGVGGPWPAHGRAPATGGPPPVMPCTSNFPHRLSDAQVASIRSWKMVSKYKRVPTPGIRCHLVQPFGV